MEPLLSLPLDDDAPEEDTAAAGANVYSRSTINSVPNSSAVPLSNWIKSEAQTREQKKSRIRSEEQIQSSSPLPFQQCQRESFCLALVSVCSNLHRALVFVSSSFNFESQLLLGCQLPHNLGRSLRVLLARQRTEQTRAKAKAIVV